MTESELKEIIRKAIDEHESQKSAAAPSKPLETHADHVCSCPDCLCDVMEKLNKTSDFVCKDCGFPLGNTVFAQKLKSCPNCGKTDTAKKVPEGIRR
jgi:deoxyribose-phosphate aldolase